MPNPHSIPDSATNIKNTKAGLVLMTLWIEAADVESGIGVESICSVGAGWGGVLSH